MKEQLKRIGGMEFFDIHLSYIDTENDEEKVVSVPEISGDKLISDTALKAGHAYFVGRGTSGQIGTCIETESPGGSGKLSITGIRHRQTKESIHTAFNYFKANRKSISANINVDSSDFMIHV